MRRLDCEEKMKSTVVLLTPADLTHKVDVYYHHAVIDTIKLCAKHGIDVVPISWPGEALVQHARNALAGLALKSNAEQFFWVDADQEWQAEQFLRLLQHPVDVVGATYLKKQVEEEYTFRTGPVIEVRNGLMAIQSMGTGFLRVSRQALQAVWNASEPYEKAGEQFRMCFDVQVIEGHLVGEDTYFCAGLADAGYQTWLDPSFTVGHNGFKRFKGDVAAYIAKLAKEHQQRQPKKVPG